MIIECKICGVKVEDNSHFWRTHKLQAVEYFQTHHPRYDLFDGSLIKFKSKEQYFTTDFNSPVNLKKWLESKPVDEIQEYCSNVLKRRKERKGLTYAPSQVELRSLKLPGVNYYNKIFGDYNKLCRELGLYNKFDINAGSSIKIVEGSAPKQLKILCDSREQKILDLNHPIKIQGLKFGDYCLEKPEMSSSIYIERKSAADLIGTFSGGFERVCREIERARDAGAYLFFLVEESLSNCLSFNKLPHVYKKNTKVTPDYIFRNIRDVIQKYPCIQFLFVKDRSESARILKKILFSGGVAKQIDCQALYDANRL